MRARSSLVAVVSTWIACACARAPAPHDAGPQATQARLPGNVDAGARAGVDVALDGETMGSTWHIKIHVLAGREDDARAMNGPIDALLERVNDEMSTYRPNSEISRFNAHASTAPFPVSPGFAAVVAKALEVGATTEGAYDITIDPLINLWGFDRKGPRKSAPTAAEIAAAKQHTGLALVHVDLGGSRAPTLRKDDPALTINLGGIAAGWAVDELAKLLEAKGLHDFMIEVTGEVRAKGKNARGQPWKIGVKVPDLESNQIVAAVPLDNRSLTTSGSYHNFFDARAEGAGAKPKRFSHIIDPKTGAPIDTDLVSVTVLFADAVTADGYDTPFLILGEEKARAIVARTPGMEALFIHQDANGKLTTRTTAGFPPLTNEAAP